MFLFFFGKPFRNGTQGKWIWPTVFTLHTIAGLAFIYIYTFIEGDGSLSQDAGAYIQESKILQEVFFTSPSDYFKLLFGFGDTDQLTQQYLLDTNHWDMGSQAISNESRNMIRLHSVLQFLSFNQPTVHMLFMALASSLSGFFLFKAVERRSHLNPLVIIGLITLLPNVLFWSSGIIKEPLYLLGFSLIVYALFSESRNLGTWLTFLIGILLLLLFKLHFLFILLAAMSVWFISRLIYKRKIIYTSVIGIGAVFVLFGIFGSLRTSLTNIISRKQFDFKNISQGGLHVDTDSCFYFFEQDQLTDLKISDDSVQIVSDLNALRLGYNEIWPPDTVKLTPVDGKWKIHFMRPRSESYFELTNIHNSFGHMLSIIPEALRNSFFRPFVSESGGVFKWVSILEWIFVWVLFLISLKWITSTSASSKEFTLFLATVIILSALLIGWTTPVSGAIVRYRVPIHLCMILFVIINWKQNIKPHE